MNVYGERHQAAEHRGRAKRSCPIMGLIVRLVAGDVFLRVPMVGLLAWNQCGLSLDRWADAKHDPVM